MSSGKSARFKRDTIASAPPSLCSNLQNDGQSELNPIRTEMLATHFGSVVERVNRFASNLLQLPGLTCVRISKILKKLSRAFGQSSRRGQIIRIHFPNRSKEFSGSLAVALQAACDRLKTFQALSLRQ